MRVGLCVLLHLTQVNFDVFHTHVRLTNLQLRPAEINLGYHILPVLDEAPVPAHVLRSKHPHASLLSEGSILDNTTENQRH